MGKFLDKLENNFNVLKKDQEPLQPKNKNEISMYFANFWYLLVFKKNLTKSNCIESLDSVILLEYILKPILGIKNENNNIVYEPGNTSLPIISEKILNGSPKTIKTYSVFIYNCILFKFFKK